MVSGRDGSTASGLTGQRPSDVDFVVPSPTWPEAPELAPPDLSLSSTQGSSAVLSVPASPLPPRPAPAPVPLPAGSSANQIALPGSSVQSPRIVNSETVINPGNQQLLKLPGGGDPVLAGMMERLFPPGSGPGSTHAGNDPAGITIGHFRVEERIGMGGMGAVFRSVDTRLDRFVALKLLSPSQSYDPAAVKRFQNEARAAARLDHENIARVFFIDEDRGLHFIAFEFVTGSNIRDLIRRKGRLTVADTVNFSMQIAYAIKHTAAMGVVHRDIKPSNIIITPTGRAKLVDLGLARKDSTESQGDLTLPGTTLGTFDYISPEQAKDPRSVDVRSDIYSLGCTIYHMLTGQPPYPDGTVLQKLLDHQGKDAPDAAALNPRVPENLSGIVRRMMNSDRSRRYQTAEQLIRDLTYVAGTLGLRGVNPEGLVWVASKSVQPRRWARHAGWMLTAAALLGIAGLLHQFGEDIGRTLSDDASNGSRLVSPDSGTGTLETAATSAAAPTTDSGKPVSETDATSSETGASATGDLALNGLKAPVAAVSEAGVEQPSSPGAGASLADVAVSSSAGPGRLDGTGPAATIEPLPGTAIASISPESAATSSKPNATSGTSTSTGTSTATGTSTSGSSGTTGSPVRTSDAGTSNGTPATTVAPVAAASPDPARPVAVYSGNATLLHEYQSLWAACAAAEDGSEIVLQFDGPRIERKACRIAGRNVTIRAARGRTPVINFIPSEIEATESRPHMLTVESGPVRLVNVEFRLTMPDAPTAERYAMFGLSPSGKLELSRVAVTIDNPRRVQAAVFGVNGHQSRMPTEMPNMPIPLLREPIALEVSDCLFRGNGGLISLSGADQSQFTIENSAVAMSGDILQLLAENGSTVSDRGVTTLSLEHVSIWTAGSLIRFPLTALGEESVINSHLRNCIYTAVSGQPLVMTEGTGSQDDALVALSWQGERNFYDATSEFWRFAGPAEPFDFSAWRDYWQPDGEVGATNEPVKWARRASVENLPADFNFSAQSPVDFALPETGPVPRATDGSNAGAGIERLPVPYTVSVRSAPAL